MAELIVERTESHSEVVCVALPWMTHRYAGPTPSAPSSCSAGSPRSMCAKASAVRSRTTRRSSDKSPRSEQPTAGARKEAIRRRITIVAAVLTALALSTCGGDSGSNVRHASTTAKRSPTCSLSAPCFGSIGASYQTAETSVANAAHDLAVSPSGYATTGAPWVETSYDQRVYERDGTPTGPCPTNSSGRFRENGGGPRGVEINDSYVWAVQARNLVRSPLGDWLATTRCDGSTKREPTLALGGSGTLLGVSVGNGEAYVTDAEQDVGGPAPVSPATAKIKVYNADLSGGLKRQWTVPHARQTSVDRQGDVWVLQQRTSSTPAKLSRYSPQGQLLTSFSVNGEPMDIAASPVADQVWIPDNGPDQDVEAYSYDGTQAKTLGRSYLSGPTPGELGPLRFAGPRGVAIDGSGDIYVTQTCNPGRGTKGWADDGYCMILSEYQPDGTQLWRVEDDVHGDVGEPAPGEHRVYTQGVILDGKAALAVPIDPWTYPNDPRNAETNLGFETTGSAQVEDVNGARLMLTVQNGFNVRVFRVVGDIAVPLASFANAPGTQDAALAANGDVYRVTVDGITRFRYNGSGYGAGQNLGLPPGFGDSRRIDIEGSQTLVSGFAPGESGANNATNYPTGRHVALFDSLPTSSWPSPTWNIQLPFSDSPRDIGVGAPAIDGNLFAIGYIADSNNWAFVRVYSMDDGRELTEIHWPQRIGGSGLYDQTRPLAAVDNVLYAEEDEAGKINTADQRSVNDRLGAAAATVPATIDHVSRRRRATISPCRRRRTCRLRAPNRRQAPTHAQRWPSASVAPGHAEGRRAAGQSTRRRAPRTSR
jgi:hypothetical protein